MYASGGKLSPEVFEVEGVDWRIPPVMPASGPYKSWRKLLVLMMNIFYNLPWIVRHNVIAANDPLTAGTPTFLMSTENFSKSFPSRNVTANRDSPPSSDPVCVSFTFASLRHILGHVIGRFALVHHFLHVVYPPQANLH